MKEQELARSALHRLTASFPQAPQRAIVFGSGLDAARLLLENPDSLPYAEIPGFPIPSVQGHEGRLWVGEVQGTATAVLSGRVHFYEGFSPQEVVYPVHLLARWGVKTLILTNAAGGIRSDLFPGDLMVITDHLNLMGINPLQGPWEEDEGPRFVDMARAYDRRLAQRLLEGLRVQGREAKSGVYAAVAGPSYETPAEARMLALLGADAVGMSTVPEVITARREGMRVAAISCITNRLAHLGDETQHGQVLNAAALAVPALVDLLRFTLGKWEDGDGQ